MTQSSTILVVGIGSPHGDDRAGWETVRSLAQLLGETTERMIRTAASPADLLDWLVGVRQLHVCDACRTRSPMGTVHRWIWAAETGVRESIGQCHSSSHQIGVAAALELAETLGILPPEVIVWGIEGQEFGAERPVAREVLAAAQSAAARIARELNDARTIARTNVAAASRTSAG